MKEDTIVLIITSAVLFIGLASFIIWALIKNKKISNFFRKIADWIGEYWRW